MIRKIIAITVAIGLFAACNNGSNKTQVKELVFAVIPSDDMVQTIKYTKNFSKYLEKELAIPVRFFTATDYTAVIEAMRTNKCHVCILGPFSYILASQKAGAEALVTIGLKSGGLYAYRSYLITNRETGIKTPGDLVKNASHLQLSFSEPASTSGHLIPRGYLTKLGLDPEKSFAGMNFTSSHAATMLSVYTGKSDVGAASSESYNRLMANGKVDSSKFVILWKSAPILTDPFCVKTSLPKDLKEKIRTAFLEMPVKDKAAFDQYIQYTYKGDSMKDSLILRAVYDSSFNSLREIARSVKSLNIK